MTDKLVSEASELYCDSMDALREQRQQIEDDLAFSDPSGPEQWDATEKRQREQDPGGARPCLVMDQLGQYVANVAGQVEQRPPSIHAIPSADGAEQRVAEKLDGFFRHIEHTSRASQHYARALTSAARAGVGYLIVRPEFTDRTLGYQEPRISSEGDPLRVVLDPWSVEIDGSDANFGFLLTPLSTDEFKRKFPKRDPISFGDKEQRNIEDTRESVLVAEQWWCEDTTETMVAVGFPDGSLSSMTEQDLMQALENGQQLTPQHTYKAKKRQVWWRKMSGCEVLEQAKGRDGKPAPYPADGIGIVPVYGYVGWSGGRMKYCGIPRRAREPQRAYNYHVSEIRAYMGQAPKAPWIVPARAVRGLEALWDRNSVESRAWLPYHDLDDQGAIAAPQRTPVSANLQNHIASAEQSLKDIQAAIGMYQANLGAPSNESSGVAIDSRKAQGEASTAHFPSHLAAALGQIGKLCLQMIPRLIDTKRQMRVLGIDETPAMVKIDPQQQDAVSESEQGISINPCVGAYDVRVVVGASFSTQRQQAQQAYTEMMRANPGLTSALAPLWAQTLDVPHADKLAQVLTAVAPDAVKAILQPDQQETQASLKGKVDQLSQALQEAIQHAKEAQQEALDANQQLEVKDDEAQARSRELDIAAYNAETNRLKVTGANDEQTKAIVADLIDQMQAQPDPDGATQQQGEPMAAPEPPEPDPRIEQLMQGHEQLMQGHQQLAQMLQESHATSLEALQKAKATRIRIPVRDKNGDILHVIDKLSNDESPPMAATE